MLQLTGPPALSTFRIAKLLRRIATVEPGVKALEARFVHFVDVESTLSAHEHGILEQLLTYGPAWQAQTREAPADTMLIVPRPGTMSPWSSKATDIAHVCGLSSVRRIERGIEYRLLDTSPLGPVRLAELAPLLFDRMTETVLFDRRHASRLFAHTPP